MKTTDIAAALIAATAAAGPTQATGASDIAMHKGVVLAWDEQTGLNTIQINGSEFSNLRVLSTSNSIMISPGDVVEIIRAQTQYFVLGRVQAPGAGAALQIRSEDVPNLESSTSGSYGDLVGFEGNGAGTVGPIVEDVYVGSSRRCLVFVGSRIQTAGTLGFMGFQVTGASNIAPSDNLAVASGTEASTTIGVSAVQIFVLTEADGLHQGFNTFTAKYRRDTLGGTRTDFEFRRVTVFPF